MQKRTLERSPITQYICQLLCRWPRQVIATWLGQCSEPEALFKRSANPDPSLQRGSPISAYSDGVVALPDFGPFELKAISILDADYPQLLKNIPDPPLVLFCLGDLSALNYPCVSIVGARKCTTLGRSIANTMAADLAAQGCTIVSGLALGIDAAAHRGCLSVAEAQTVAVLGAGFAHLYPQQNRGLAASILAANGLLLSEYPAALPPRPYRFPERNRIISGLSELTVLVEAGDKSGSLITARLALEQGREVYAVPGSALSPLSSGCHRLIRQGAPLVTNVQEIAEEMGWELSASGGRASTQPTHPAATSIALDDLSARVLETIAAEPHQLDEIVALTSDDPQQISQCLMQMQLSGFVRHGPDGYIRVL